MDKKVIRIIASFVSLCVLIVSIFNMSIEPKPLQVLQGFINDFEGGSLPYPSWIPPEKRGLLSVSVTLGTAQEAADPLYNLRPALQIHGCADYLGYLHGKYFDVGVLQHDITMDVQGDTYHTGAQIRTYTLASYAKRGFLTTDQILIHPLVGDPYHQPWVLGTTAAYGTVQAEWINHNDLYVRCDESEVGYVNKYSIEWWLEYFGHDMNSLGGFLMTLLAGLNLLIEGIISYFKVRQKWLAIVSEENS